MVSAQKTCKVYRSGFWLVFAVLESFRVQLVFILFYWQKSNFLLAWQVDEIREGFRRTTSHVKILKKLKYNLQRQETVSSITLLDDVNHMIVVLSFTFYTWNHSLNYILLFLHFHVSLGTPTTKIELERRNVSMTLKPISWEFFTLRIWRRSDCIIWSKIYSSKAPRALNLLGLSCNLA